MQSNVSDTNLKISSAFRAPIDLSVREKTVTKKVATFLARYSPSGPASDRAPTAENAGQSLSSIPGLTYERMQNNAVSAAVNHR